MAKTMVSSRESQPAESSRPDEWLLRTSALSCTYPGDVRAVDKLALNVASGQITALIGPSGCGKSTILSALAGLMPHTGSIEWNPDVVLSLRGTSRRLLTLMFQRDTVLPWLTVQQNVEFGLKTLKLPRAERNDRVGMLLELTGLEEYRTAHPRHLSGGMRRRVALMTALAPMPRMLLLDEPFAALDEPTRIGIHQDLFDMARRMNIACLLVTHDMSEAVSLAGNVIVLSRRPATIAHDVETELGDERDMRTIRSSEVFQEKYTLLWQALWEQIGGADE